MMLNTVVVSGAVSAFSAVAGWGATVAEWGATNATAVGMGANVVSAAKSMDAQDRAAKKQKKIQKAQATEIKKQQKISLEKRKGQIDLQRKQILGSGDSDYSINKTGDSGDVSAGSLTGVSLG